MVVTSFTIFSEVKLYLGLSQELQEKLFNRPDDWRKYQEVFNLTLDKIYDNIMQFERENIENDAKVYKLRRIFEKRYRRYFFLHGEFIKWTYEKPFGYAGDFKIIDDIYRNQPRTTGFDRLWDNWFQQLAAAKAVRERKENFKEIISDFAIKHKKEPLCIMNLASGPAREIKELIEGDFGDIFSRVSFDCYDFDDRAINYAKQLLNNATTVNFFQNNAVRLALKKDVKAEVPRSYDLIYSTGLFDYLDERLAVRLVSNLKKLLSPGGVLVIANVGDKYNNSSAGWMEWVSEWYLIYRTEEEFRRIFSDAGFLPENLKIMTQQSKVMQYCIAYQEE